MVEGNILKVSTVSDPAKVGGAIAGVMKDQYKTLGNRATVELRGLGAGAVNQAIKAVICARGYLAPVGMNIYCIPAFGEDETADNGEGRTLVRLIVKTEV